MNKLTAALNRERKKALREQRGKGERGREIERRGEGETETQREREGGGKREIRY